MDGERISGFGGTTGRVVCDAMSFGTAVTGLVLGIAIVAESFVLGFVGARVLAQLVAQVIFGIVLARFTLNGMSGESRGTIFSTIGGSWFLALAVAGRYLVLNALWSIPFALVVWRIAASVVSATPAVPADPGSAEPMPLTAVMMLSPGMRLLMSRPIWMAVGLGVFGLVLLPPVFLIVSVRSERFADIFSPPHWQATFGGRGADLYNVYTTYAGGLGMMVVLAVPCVALGLMAAPEIGYLFMFIAFAFAMGLAVSLLGRLCGFFAFGGEAGGPVMAGGPGPEANEPPVHRSVASNVVPHPAVVSAHAMPARVASGGAAPGPGAEEAPGVVADGSGLPPLLDADARVAAATQKFETDPSGAIGDLDELRRTHAPDPRVLHAWTLGLHRAGRADEAVAAARETVPLCLARGAVALAAEIYAAVWKRAKELGLNHEQIDMVASALFKGGDLGRATSAYGLALSMDQSDRKAIKGLMQIADHRLRREGKPKDAARIYTFLLQYAADSPFAEHMKQGLADAEARAARTGT